MIRAALHPSKVVLKTPWDSRGTPVDHPTCRRNLKELQGRCSPRSNFRKYRRGNMFKVKLREVAVSATTMWCSSWCAARDGQFWKKESGRIPAGTCHRGSHEAIEVHKRQRLGGGRCGQMRRRKAMREDLRHHWPTEACRARGSRATELADKEGG